MNIHVTDLAPNTANGRLTTAEPQFSKQYRVVYADTDAMGVVYHGKYLEIAERSRTEFLRLAGVDPFKSEQCFDVLMLVNRVRVDYRIPLRLHQVADVSTSLIKLGTGSATWRTQIHKDGVLLANVDVLTACFSRSLNQVVATPAPLQRMLLNLAGAHTPSPTNLT